jgi:hypothetical protein
VKVEAVDLEPPRATEDVDDDFASEVNGDLKAAKTG